MTGLSHFLLGVLRDGRPHHGYQLMTQYRARVGEPANAGGVYRVLRRLVAQGLARKVHTPPDADERRIRYEITDDGQRKFDEWLASPGVNDRTFSVWALFIDRVPHARRERTLDQRKADLSLRAMRLAREHKQALAAAGSSAGYEALPPQLARQRKLLAAELEFLREFRAGLRIREEVPDLTGPYPRHDGRYSRCTQSPLRETDLRLQDRRCRQE